MHYWLTGHSNPEPEYVEQMAKLVKLDVDKFDDLWLAWWKQGVEKGFVKETIAAKRLLRLLESQEMKSKQ